MYKKSCFIDEAEISYQKINDAIVECLTSGSWKRAKGIADYINRKYETKMNGLNIEGNLTSLYKNGILEKRKHRQTHIYRFINSFFDKTADEAEKFIEGNGQDENDIEDYDEDD